MRYFRMGETTLFHCRFHPFRWSGKAAPALAVAWTCILFASFNSAQAAAPGTGDLHGVIRDAHGAPLAGARVIVHNIADTTDQDLVSDRVGEFQAPNLRPGRYRLTASQEGVGGSSVMTVDLAPLQELHIVMTITLPAATKAGAAVNLTTNAPGPPARNDVGDPPLTERERLLLERLDRLEQRLAAMEAKQAQGGVQLEIAAKHATPPASATAAVPNQAAAEQLPLVASLGPISALIPAPRAQGGALDPAPNQFETGKANPPKPTVTSPTPPMLPEAIQAPEAPPPNSENVYTWADFTWLNGTSRNKDTVLDTKFFTPEVRFDSNFTEDFNQPIDHSLGGSTETFRSGEIQVEQASVGGDFHWQNVRGRILTMFGLFATTTPRNDASAAVGQWDVRGAYRYVSEAYGGYHFNVNRGLNIDAGIFVSYIGLFSYYNFDNWVYQPSYVSSNTPWFFNGLRIQWFPTKKLKIEPWIINGWQSYNLFNGHHGFGGQILYRPTEWLALVFNNYGNGTDNLGLPHVQRIHTDDSILVRYYNKPDSTRISKMGFSLTGDLGCQYGPGFQCTRGTNKDSFAGWMAYNRTWFKKDTYALTFGGGKMNNPGRYLTLLPPIDGADAISGTPYFTENPGQPTHMWDTSIGFQWMPRQYVTWWVEAGHRHSDVPYWTGRHGITPPGGNNGAPQFYTCRSGSTAGTADLVAATAACGGPGSVWFPDLRRTQDVLSAGVMVKF